MSKIVNSMTIRHLAKGNHIFKEGDPADFIYIIADGEIELS